MARGRKRVTERRLVDVLVCYMRKGHTVAREVPHYEKRIDVVTVDPESGTVCAIEAKTVAWERAIGQAVVNLTVADVSYIAIYSQYIHRVPKHLLDQHGIGLIAVGTAWGDVEVIVEAQKSPYQNRILVDQLRRDLLPGYS